MNIELLNRFDDAYPLGYHCLGHLDKGQFMTFVREDAKRRGFVLFECHHGYSNRGYIMHKGKRKLIWKGEPNHPKAVPVTWCGINWNSWARL